MSEFKKSLSNNGVPVAEKRHCLFFWKNTTIKASKKQHYVKGFSFIGGLYSSMQGQRFAARFDINCSFFLRGTAF